MLFLLVLFLHSRLNGKTLLTCITRSYLFMEMKTIDDHKLIAAVTYHHIRANRMGSGKRIMLDLRNSDVFLLGFLYVFELTCWVVGTQACLGAYAN